MRDFYIFSGLVFFILSKFNLIKSPSTIGMSIHIIRVSQPYQNKHKCGTSHPATGHQCADQITYDAETASLVMH